MNSPTTILEYALQYKTSGRLASFTTPSDDEEEGTQGKARRA